ncbi:hypothetical protein OEZ86_014516 [Tetradesmus obliquus]|nr:hypothetical protein OEZ86_014516 [Tetradesmus obliquus]
MGPGSLGVPLPVGLAPAAMLAPLESPGWAQTLVAPSFGFPYGYAGTSASAGYPVQCYQQHAGKGPAAMPAAPSSNTDAGALGDRAFFSMRCLMVKQQEAFVAQLFELHRLSRVQAMLQSEVEGEHARLTQQYEQEAVASLQCSQALQQRSGSTAGNAVNSRSLATAAAAAGKQRKQPQQQLQLLLAGARPVEGDDRGAAAVAHLPVHAALLANLPSTLRAAVAQPAESDYAALNPNTYYVRQAPGVLRPTPMRYVGRSSGKGGSIGGMATAAAAAGARSVAPAASGEETVQAAQHVAAAAAQQQQMQHEQQQQQQQMMDTAAGMQQGASGLNVFRPMPQIDPSFASKFLAGGQGSAGAAAALGAAAPRPVVHWWQDAAATFGEIGLVDPNGCGAGSKAEGTSRKRDFPQQYSLQHLPHKKRVKHAAAAAGSYGGSYYSGGYGYDQAAAGMGGWDGTPEGAFQPPMRAPSASKERSRVRSNRMGGSSRACESSVCSDNSASSIDNPSYIAAAAAAAAAAAGAGELGPDADGVSLLLHMGQAAAAQHAAGSVVAGRRGSNGGRGSGTGGAGGRSSSCAASAVGGAGGHSTAKSAAGILLSLSASQSDAL